MLSHSNEDHPQTSLDSIATPSINGITTDNNREESTSSLRQRTNLASNNKDMSDHLLSNSSQSAQDHLISHAVDEDTARNDTN